MCTKRIKILDSHSLNNECIHLFFPEKTTGQVTKLEEDEPLYLTEFTTKSKDLSTVAGVASFMKKYAYYS